MTRTVSIISSFMPGRFWEEPQTWPFLPCVTRMDSAHKIETPTNEASERKIENTTTTTMSSKNYGAPPPTAPAYPVASTVTVQEPVRQRRTTAGAPSASKTTSNPPPGAPDGGSWGSVKYAGETTNLMCIVLCLLGGLFTGCGTCAYLCPMDKKDGYHVGGSVSLREWFRTFLR